jgi:hypothetical protein
MVDTAFSLQDRDNEEKGTFWNSSDCLTLLAGQRDDWSPMRSKKGKRVQQMGEGRRGGKKMKKCNLFKPFVREGFRSSIMSNKKFCEVHTH